MAPTSVSGASTPAECSDSGAPELFPLTPSGSGRKSPDIVQRPIIVKASGYLSEDRVPVHQVLRISPRSTWGPFSKLSVRLGRSGGDSRLRLHGDPRLEPEIQMNKSFPKAEAGAQAGNGEFLPVRMVAEYCYCPRLFHLMHVDGRWEDNRYTAEGREVHRRVDRIDQVLPDAQEAEEEAGGGEEAPEISRSVTLGSERLGIVAKLDLVSTAGREALPVETKRGKVPDNAERSYEPERVQLMAQGLLLREHGYDCDHGMLYFHGSRTRVEIPFTEELEGRTLAAIRDARVAQQSRELPLPLEDSPKCYGCSLSGICMPDETLALQLCPPDPEQPKMRRLYPARTDARPFYVQEQGSYVGKKGSELCVKRKGELLGTARFKDLSSVVLMGGVQISTQCVQALSEASIPVCYFSTGHWFYGMTHGHGLQNSYDRAAQFEYAASPERCLEFARAVVLAKGSNQRTQLRRNAEQRPQQALDEMKQLLQRVPAANSLGELLGLEGQIAALYFRNFSEMLRPRDLSPRFDFNGRNRRPPKDPINALLSFGYATLARECTTALMAEGLDPWWGLYHKPRHGRPALALDLMEEFRTVIVDSAVLLAVNTGMLNDGQFLQSKGGCILEAGARKAFLRAYESRIDQILTHPLFDYRLSWRAAIQIQARILARWFRGDIPAYEGIRTR
ncbi:MAG: CRISPR-associated endonuclease Cas4/Cas1 [Planctomycetota bacterium]|nr:MAG: CRISPR-associated endonuclease Cas4/Cas1 [Planctomycetota bacterium]